MTFLKRSDSIVLAAVAALLIIMTPQMSSAGTINIYGIPDHIRHAAYPCIFAGNDGCNKDPAGWPAPTESTTQNWNPPLTTLLQDYIGSDFDAWNSIVGSTFILGLDFNSDVSHATLETLTMTFYNGATLLDTWSLAGPGVTPDLHNGDGYADYVFAAGCTGLQAAVPDKNGNPTSILSCSQYTPFTLPTGTNRIYFSFLYSSPDDGDEDLYVIQGSSQPLPEVPEPATLLLLSTGLFLAAWQLRRRV